jgi:peptidoglycan/xylan/chitin deacetylase (PgdA/CDA1 family)
VSAAAGRRLPALATLLVTLAAGGCGGAQDSSKRASAPAHRPARASSAAVPAVPLMDGAASRRAAVPILMYHVVTAPASGTPNADLWVPARLFAAQLRALAQRGYHGVSLGQVWRAWHGRARLPHRPLVVSFDDGYLSQFTKAAPVLRALHWPGVLNLKVDNLGPTGIPRHGVRRMAAAGWEIDSHTVTHPDLTTVDAARLRSELVDSRARIAALVGRAPEFFCYPSGRHDARVEAAVRAAGYDAATTVALGAAKPGGDPYALPRVRVHRDESPAALVRTLASLGV